MIKRQASVKMLHRESLLNRPAGTCVDPHDQFGLLIHQTTYVADVFCRIEPEGAELE